MQRRRVIIFLKPRTGLQLDLQKIKERLSMALDCHSLLISSETKENFDLEVGVLGDSALKSAALAKKIKSLFFDSTCKVKSYKGWGPVCTHFSEKKFVSFGSYSEKQVREMAHKIKSHKKVGNFTGGRSPRVGLSRSRSRSRSWSTWFVIKRIVLFALLSQIVRFFLEKLGGLQLFPGIESLVSFFEGMIRPRAEEVPPPSVPEPSKGFCLWEVLCPILFVGVVYIIRLSNSN